MSVDWPKLLVQFPARRSRRSLWKSPRSRARPIDVPSRSGMLQKAARNSRAHIMKDLA